GRLPVPVAGVLDDVHATSIDVQAHALLPVAVGELARPERAVDDDLRPGCEPAVLRQRGQALRRGTPCRAPIPSGRFVAAAPVIDGDAELDVLVAGWGDAVLDVAPDVPADRHDCSCH